MAHGISKKNKWLLIKFCVPILCIIISITLHDLGSHIYKAHFHTTSSGVGLGFVAFYFTYFIFPSYFAINFINYKEGASLFENRRISADKTPAFVVIVFSGVVFINYTSDTPTAPLKRAQDNEKTS